MDAFYVSIFCLKMIYWMLFVFYRICQAIKACSFLQNDTILIMVRFFYYIQRPISLDFTFKGKSQLFWIVEGEKIIVYGTWSFIVWRSKIQLKVSNIFVYTIIFKCMFKNVLVQKWNKKSKSPFGGHILYTMCKFLDKINQWVCLI